MPWARRMFSSPAASAAPVDPPLTSASARPSATARAARTIEASGVERAAATGSATLAIETGASTISTNPSGASMSPNWSAGPNSSVRTPWRAAMAAPAPTSAGPRSAPLVSTATVTGEASPRGLVSLRELAQGLAPAAPAAPESGEASPRRLVSLREPAQGLAPAAPAAPDPRAAITLVLVAVVLGVGLEHRASRVGAAGRADPVRTARAVAIGARVDRRRRDLVLRSTLRRAAVRLLLLRDGHERRRRVADRTAA